MRARIKRFFQSAVQAMSPNVRTWHGAAWGVLTVTTILWLITGYYVLSDGKRHLGTWLVFLAFTLGMPLAGLLVRLILNLLRARNPFFSWTVAACLALLLAVFLSAGGPG